MKTVPEVPKKPRTIVDLVFPWSVAQHRDVWAMGLDYRVLFHIKPRDSKSSQPVPQPKDLCDAR